ncbi:MAG: hypothetical protein ACQKBY_10810 [Verrucomicrobiales bacterium]
MKVLFRLLSGMMILAGGLVLSSCSSPGGGPAFAGESARATSPPGVASAPVERPGLGTSWGESLDSEIVYQKFRRSTSQPLAVSTIYYNDEEGVRLQSGGSVFRARGPLRDESGRLRWGVKTGWGFAKTVFADEKSYVIGRKGETYRIYLENTSRVPVEVVVSVDGLDVMDGKRASVRKRGYLIAPGKSLEIKGFRKSHSQVAAFTFGSVADSYSQRKHGTSRDVGVIGLAVYEDAEVRSDIRRREGASPFAEAP